MKYLIPLLLFAASLSPYITVNGVASSLGGFGSLVYGFLGLITAAWAYGKADMPLSMGSVGGK